MQGPSGGAGRDTRSSIENLNGSVYGDRLTGNTAANVLTGGKGGDILSGAAGNDTLNGGPGSDKLSGGAGKDSLLFDKYAFSGRDQILDFRGADDTIKLENALLSRLAREGGLDAGNYRENSRGTAQDANDFIVFTTRAAAGCSTTPTPTAAARAAPSSSLPCTTATVDTRVPASWRHSISSSCESVATVANVSCGFDAICLGWPLWRCVRHRGYRTSVRRGHRRDLDRGAGSQEEQKCNILHEGNFCGKL